MVKIQEKEEGRANAGIEFIKILPQLLWGCLAAIAFYFFYPHLILLLDKGGITKLAVVGVQIELRNLPDNKGADGVAIAKQAIIPPDKQEALTARFAQLSKQTLGATVLWVDDNHPNQNVRERRVLLAAGINVDLARSTEEALRWLSNSDYDVVITDLARPNDLVSRPCYPGSAIKSAGCHLLREIGLRPYQKPAMIIYAGQVDEAFGTPPHAACMTNRPDRLMNCVLNAIEESRQSRASPVN